MCEIGKRGEPPLENPGQTSGGREARPPLRPARLRPRDVTDTPPRSPGFKPRSEGHRRRGISQGPTASHARRRHRAPPELLARARRPPQLGRGRGRAPRREATPPPPPRVGGGASDASSGKSPFRRAVRPAPCPCRGILAGRRQDTGDPSAKILGWEGVSRKPRGAGKEEEARGWSEDWGPGCRGCSAS